MHTPRRTMIVLAASLALLFSVAPASAQGEPTTVFRPPNVSDTAIVGPMYYSDSQGINIQGPEIYFGQNKEQGAQTIQLPAVQTPAGQDITP